MFIIQLAPAAVGQPVLTSYEGSGKSDSQQHRKVVHGLIALGLVAWNVRKEGSLCHGHSTTHHVPHTHTQMMTTVTQNRVETAYGLGFKGSYWLGIGCERQTAESCWGTAWRAAKPYVQQGTYGIYT